jgi:hypothetical protein
MHDQAAEIEEHPIAAPFAFAVQAANAAALRTLYNFVANGLELARAESGADYKIISERAKPREVEEDNILRLFFLRGVDSRANVKRNRILSCRHR